MAAGQEAAEPSSTSSQRDPQHHGQTPALNGQQPQGTSTSAVVTEGDDDDRAFQKLHNEWVLWYDNPRLAPANNTWKENLKQVGTFRTPSDFWSIYNNVQPPSHLGLNSNYHLFKEGVEPMWEDPENKDGGKWIVSIPKKDPRNARKCDEWWTYTVLAMLGETMDETGDVVCGAVVSIRKQHDRIALWLKTNDGELAMKIGARWKKALEIQNKLKYQLHADAAATGSSFKNEVYFEV